MEVLELFRNKIGLEVGGPSRMFGEGQLFPIYTVALAIDGCNFSSNTLWEKNLLPGKNYKTYGEKIGMQYICEATALEFKLSSGYYDFIICSNCLEHSANPLKVLEQFLIVLKIGGLIFLALPKKEVTFDHNRSVSTFEHLFDDYIKGIGEDDLSHLDEILALHDLALDPSAGNIEQFTARSLDNYNNRGLHQHVFDGPLLAEIFDRMCIDVVYQQDIGSDYVIIGSKK